NVSVSSQAYGGRAGKNYSRRHSDFCRRANTRPELVPPKERRAPETHAVRELRRRTSRALLRAMRASRDRLPSRLPACHRRYPRVIPELGFEIFRHNCTPHFQTVASDQRISRRTSRAPCESTAPLSTRKHLVFLCC